MRHSLFFLICVLVVAVAPSRCDADTIPLILDPGFSFVTLSIDGEAFQQSPATGTATVDLSAHSATSGTGQVTTLDLTLTNGLSFPGTIPILGGATASTTGGDVSFSLVAPGAAGTIVPAPAGISGGNFSQLANEIAADGDVIFSSILGFTIFDLDTLTISPTDFNGIGVDQSGDTFTVGGNFLINQELDVDGTIVTLDAVGQFFGSGIKTVPEPGSTMILIGMGTVLLTRRQR